MRGKSPPAPDATLVHKVVELARLHGDSWFPQLGPGPTATLLKFQARPRCFLYRFSLRDRATTRDVIVKVRHSDPKLRRADRYHDRPELTPQRTLPDADAAQREFAGLQLIAAAMQGSDASRFGVLRGLAQLPEHAAIVMEHVAQPTLRELVGRRRTRTVMVQAQQRQEDRVWGPLGQWLHRFHGADGAEALPLRMTRRDELIDHLDRSWSFLARTGADVSSIRDLAEAATQRADDAFDDELPSAVGHGDFTAQNVFVEPLGRLTVFDPLPIWRVCVFEDLGRLTMGLRLLGPQVVSGGRLVDPAVLDDWESQLISGYSPATETTARLQVYQAVLLLDRWGELVSKRPARGRLRRGVRSVRVRVAGGWFQQEARRLAGLLR